MRRRLAVLSAHLRPSPASAEVGGQNSLAGKVVHAIALVSPQNVAGLLRDHRTPKKLAALKVDIDSIDLPVLEAILEAGYRPMVIMVEINPDVPPPARRFRQGDGRLDAPPDWAERSQGIDSGLSAPPPLALTSNGEVCPRLRILPFLFCSTTQGFLLFYLSPDSPS